MQSLESATCMEHMWVPNIVATYEQSVGNDRKVALSDAQNPRLWLQGFWLGKTWNGVVLYTALAVAQSSSFLW